MGASLLDTAASLFFIVTAFAFMYKINKLAKAVDEDVIEISDYTVYVKGLPGNVSDSEEVRCFFEIKFGDRWMPFDSETSAGALAAATAEDRRAPAWQSFVLRRLTWHSGSLGPVETPRVGARREGLAHVMEDDASMTRSVNDESLAPDRRARERARQWRSRRASADPKPFHAENRGKSAQRTEVFSARKK